MLKEIKELTDKDKIKITLQNGTRAFITYENFLNQIKSKTVPVLKRYITTKVKKEK